MAGRTLALGRGQSSKQRPDPGVDVTVEELQQAWRHTWVELAGSRDWTHDQCAEVNGKLQLLVRLNDRMRNIASSEAEAKELPPEINLDKVTNIYQRNNADI